MHCDRTLKLEDSYFNTTAKNVTKFSSWECVSECLHLSKSNFQEVSKHYEKPVVHLLGGGLKSINPPSINFITCFLLLGHPETPKGKLLVLCWKIVPRKRNYSDRLNPLFFLSIKRATKPPVDERATRAPVCAAECGSKAMFHGKQNVLYSCRATQIRI